MAMALIIDDSKLARVMAGKLLREAGYQTIEAENGRQGVELASEQRPDLMLLDMLMPEMDGVQALTAMKEIGMDIPVIMLTADIQESVKDVCLNLGVVAFLNKPVNKANLMAALELTQNLIAGARPEQTGRSF